MFETVDYRVRFEPAVPDVALRRFDELHAAISLRSIIVWGEHCTECAFPACYSTCSFYTPRSDDMNCARFEDGIRKGRVGDHRVATISFRKWGRLLGRGPVHLVSPVGAERRERVDEWVTRSIVHGAPFAAVRRLNWEWNKRKVVAGGASNPDAFVVEAWVADGGRALNCSLTLMPVDQGSVGLYQSSFELRLGYNRLIFPIADIATRLDLSQPYFIQLMPFEDSLGRDVTFGLVEFVKFRHEVEQVIPAATRASIGNELASPKAKCVVWDLDNTLWRGTLAEDGIEALSLNPVVRPLIEELDRRGILQSVASKNDPESTMEALEAFGLREYFLYPQISWNAKSTAIEQIAQALDIGLDTFVFVDDQPFERGEVGERLPMVTVLSDTDLDSLLERPQFDVPVTKESVGRRAMYMAEQHRQSTFQQSEIDYSAFLRGCEIVVEVARLSSDSAERAYELSQRTNQLNVSGRRYSREEIDELRRSSARRSAFLFSCRDRFGEYGTIAMCVIDIGSGKIESFMMSCRVQRKRVEQAIFSWLLAQCADVGVLEICATYRKTKRNEASVRMFEELGFRYLPEDGESGCFAIGTDHAIAESEIVRVHDLAAVRAPNAA